MKILAILATILLCAGCVGIPGEVSISSHYNYNDYYRPYYSHYYHGHYYHPYYTTRIVYSNNYNRHPSNNGRGRHKRH